MTLLNAKYSLLGIADVEGFTGRIVKHSGLRLSVQDREELHVWLIEECWLLSRRYEPQPSGITFSSWAGHKLRLRVVDWQRSRFGRTRWQFAGRVYERERPRLVSLDADDSERVRLVDTLAASSVDSDASGFAADMRALDRRSSGPGRCQDWSCDETDGETA